jgi:hypothetical protein
MELPVCQTDGLPFHLSMFVGVGFADRRSMVPEDPSD